MKSQSATIAVEAKNLSILGSSALRLFWLTFNLESVVRCHGEPARQTAGDLEELPFAEFLLTARIRRGTLQLQSRDTL